MQSISAKSVVISVSPEGTSLEGLTANELAIVERQQSLTVVDLEKEIAALTADADTVSTEIQGLQITNDAELQKMNTLLNKAKDTIKDASTLTTPLRAFLHNLHAKACNIGSGSLKKLQEAAKTADSRMKQYAQTQKAAAERARQVSEEAVRKKNEEDARLAREAEEARLREAAVLREEGRMREAKALEAAGAVAPVIPMPTVAVVQTAAPKLAGTTSKWPWTAKVVDRIRIIRAVALTGMCCPHCKEPLQEESVALTYGGKDLIEVNETLLKALGKQRQADLGIPGAESFEEPQFSRSRS